MIASRLDDQINGVMIVVGQRMHEDDLSGNLLQNGGWKHVCLPWWLRKRRPMPSVIQPGTERPVNRCWSIGGRKQSSIGSGKRLRDRSSPLSISRTRQRPGELIRPGQIKHFDDLPPDARQITLSWDTAVKTGSGNSYTVCLVIARDTRRHYVTTYCAHVLNRLRCVTLLWPDHSL
jgi:hypothetical protein